MVRLLICGLALASLFISGCRSNESDSGSSRQNMTDTTKYKYTNSLIKETSPYLLQHAHNPVDWHAWNKETLEKAIKENKPLLVSIGYAACHWCHVMEHESFEDEEVAELMNAHFICIKVDREERPDVDQFYMTAANLITGGGGWPLNCFAMPDGRVFHAGTYFRKQDWIRLLGSVSEEYEKNRDKLSEFADQVSQGIRQSQSIPFIEADQSFDTDVLHRSVLKWTQQFDAMNGGPNRAPKFPLPDNYLFLMQYAHQFANEQVWKHVEKTLHKMGDGGIFDQVGGGFCRYSVDEKWKVPHFEKMLYDNAQLISLYATAYKKTRNEYYLEIARKCADFCIRELCSEEGVFYSSLDADSEGEEGKFYTWSEQELVEVLGKDMELARLYFHIDSKGMWEDKYILMRKLDKEEIKDELRISEEQYQKKVNSMFESLGKARSNRVRPGLDDKSLTSWNALMITGLVDLYQASGDNEYLAQAKKTLRFLLGKQVEGNRIFHNYKEGKSTIPGFLEDYAFLVSAIIKMNEADPGSGDLDLADQLTQATIDSFYNRSDRTFQFTSVRSKELAVAPLEVMDNVIPSSMAVTVRNLRKMYLVTGHEEYETIALDLLHRVLPRVESYGSGFSHWMQEMMALVTSPKEVVVIGENAGERAIDLTMNYLPGTLVLTASGPSEQLIFKDRYQGDRTLIYVCTNRACRAPVEDPRQALVALR